MTMSHSWQDIARKTQRYRDDTIARIRPSIPDVPHNLPSNVTELPRQLLTDAEIKITESSAETLVASLAAGILTSVQVTTAFLRRAGLAQKLANCITEVMPETAIERAAFLDRYLAEHKRPIGPLHGLPVSIKEHISIAGLKVNCAFVAWHDRDAVGNAHIVELLLAAGAVLYVRTTEPQLLMHLETSSNLYGETVNPYNNHLTSGGSSGGEGALLALRGSCLGLGTDIGGSVRSPAANNGIWSFRPSGKRLPGEGADAPMAGYDSITPVVGPMSTSLDGLNLLMTVVLAQKPWVTEPALIPLPWNYPSANSHLITVESRKQLKVAVLWHDGIVRPHPPITRCLTSLTERLRSIPNIKVVDWIPYKHDHAWDIASALYFPDGGAEETAILASANEPWRPLSNFIIKDQKNVKELSIAELWTWNAKREKYRIEYAAHWNATAAADSDGRKVDVILSPVGPGAAPPLDHSRYWNYTSQWNVVDYPALVFPYGKVDPNLDRLTEEDLAYEPTNLQDLENWKLWTGMNGAGGYTDAPIGLQLIARRYEDEKLFEAMQMIKDAAGI